MMVHRRIIIVNHDRICPTEEITSPRIEGCRMGTTQVTAPGAAAHDDPVGGGVAGTPV